MREWRFLLGGLIIWTVHFFALYIVASVFLTTPLARLLTVLITLACLAGEAVLFARARKSAQTREPWLRTVALSSIGLSAVAITWQGLPALLG